MWINGLTYKRNSPIYTVNKALLVVKFHPYIFLDILLLLNAIKYPPATKIAKAEYLIKMF